MTFVLSKPCSLADLPAPPEGRHGWPWDSAPAPLPATAPDGQPWPEISIITPSYNQGQYIEETIRSILLQGYPALEYLIIDGGSNDATVEIIRKYEPWLSGWVSEKDKGQSDAINKGFSRTSGEIFNWMCSDDVLTPGALQKVATTFLEKPQTGAVAGACFCQYDEEPEKNIVRKVEWKGWELTPYAAAIWQPSCYFRRSLIGRDDLVLRNLHFCMDRELWSYLCARGAKWYWEDEVLSVYRFTGANKSMVGKHKIIDELDTIYRSYVPERAPLPFFLKKIWLPLVLANIRHKSGLVRFLSLGASRAVAMVLLALYPRERVRALQREFYEYSVW
ncbi:MAG: glycosyltransferase [Verrucomicrobiaceae bacterium]|nr:MAG: glycosyltransferase [Verrucomicrobiaceae bacterium]